MGRTCVYRKLEGMSEDELRGIVGKLEAHLEDIRDTLNLQRQEGKERGDKIVELLEKTADMEARLCAMERHVRNECVVNNGTMDKIKGDIAKTTTQMERLKVSFYWIVAGSALGGGAASGMADVVGRMLGL